MLLITVLCVCANFISLFSLNGGIIHTNEFAVKIPGPQEHADLVAKKYGFVNKGQIGSLEGYYLFKHHSIKKRSIEPSSIHSSFLHNESMVHWYEQQVIKSRVKRSIITDSSFKDPLYPEQWFLHKGGYGGYDMNVDSAWKKGYTGKGVVVSILDDGIQGNHPDLALNYDKEASWDINDSDDDPSPQDDDDNKHGTRCAGEVAAVANNEFCGVGVAYDAKIGGVRMLDGSVTDCIEATALSLKPNHIHIYSASWGPEDDGKTVDGPGVLAKVAFEDGVKKGRNGLGSIFVWASGNGGKHSDNCNCDGYTNSIYTISISSATQSGLKPWYLEECSSTLATTYSSGASSRDQNIVTVDVNYSYLDDIKREKKPNTSNLCTKSHTGTSASAPIAAGLCALALEANPNLSWRDMQYIIVLTSRHSPLHQENDWITNGVGRKISTKFGYGLMDGDGMVTVAAKWKTLPSQHICSTVPDTREKIIPTGQDERLEATITSDGCENTENTMRYLEHVQVRITLTFHPRGNLHIILVSPSGTPSDVLLPRAHDRKENSFTDWPFMSVHFWGESVTGTWKLIIINEGNLVANVPGKLKNWSITFYGTEKLPAYVKSTGIRESEMRKKVQHPHPIRGLSDLSDDTDIADDTDDYDVSIEDCKSHKKYYIVLDEEPSYCTDKCPSGYYGSKKDSTCHSCDQYCYMCYGPSYNNCLECNSKYFLLNSTCVKSCPEGYFSNIHSSSRICIPCSESCMLCKGSAHECTACKNGLYLYKSQCLPYCPTGTYTAVEKCIECSKGCKSCYGPESSDCLSCSFGFFLTNTSCLSECPKGYYFNNDNRCLKCPRSCITCTTPPTMCETCSDGYIMQDSSMTCEHMDCYARTSTTCFCLSESCLLCYPSQTKCIICKNGYLWHDDMCVERCPDGSYQIKDHDYECQRCLGQCHTCETNAYQCTHCNAGFYLYKNHCLEVCPPGYYGTTEMKVCRKCHSTCKECFGASSSQCISCSSERYLLHNTCVESCSPGFYKISHSNVRECAQCHPSCKECSDYGPRFCTGCFPGQYLIDNACIPCLDGEFYNDVTMVCEKCHYNCGACYGPFEHQCTSCVQPFRLYERGHKCLSCCDHEKNEDCCFCRGDLDICVVDHRLKADSTIRLDSDDQFSKNVIPIAIGVSALVIVVFVILFAILQYKSSGWCHFTFGRKKYMPVPRDMSAKYNIEQEKISLTQEDLEEEDDIFQKLEGC